MAVKVHLFGQLKQIVGLPVIETNAADTDLLMKELAIQFPMLKDLSCLIAIDKTIIHSNTVIKDGQDLAIMPPYSGG